MMFIKMYFINFKNSFENKQQQSLVILIFELSTTIQISI